MKFFLALLPTILLTAYGQLMTKWRVTGLDLPTEGSKFDRLFSYLTDPFIISAYVCALLASFAWLYVVEKYPVSLAFPAYVGLLFVVVLFGSRLLLHETISLQQWAGIALIFTGVLVASRA